MRVLEDCRGKVPQAARALGIDRTSLYRLLKKYNIQLDRRVVSAGVSTAPTPS